MQLPSTGQQRSAPRAARSAEPPARSRSCAKRCWTSSSASRARTTTRCSRLPRDAAPRTSPPPTATSAAVPARALRRRRSRPRLRPARRDPRHAARRRSRRSSSRERAKRTTASLTERCARRRTRRSTPICSRKRRSRSCSRGRRRRRAAICSSAPSPPRPIKPTITRCSAGPCSAENAGATRRRRARRRVAWLHLHQAFAIDPDSLDAHDYAGRIAASPATTSAPSSISSGCSTPIRPAPTRLPRSRSACPRRGECKRLERQYRKLIHRLGDRHDPERALRLWWRLAELYRTAARRSRRRRASPTRSPPSSRPTIRVRARRWRALYAEDPETWREAAQALRDSCRLSPDDAHAGPRALPAAPRRRALGRRLLPPPRRSRCAASTTRVATDFLRRFRPRFLARAQHAVGCVPVAAEACATPTTIAICSRSVRAPVRDLQPPLSLGRARRQPDRSHRASLVPEPFARVRQLLAVALGVAVPPVFRRGDFSDEAHVGAARRRRPARRPAVAGAQ